MKRLALLVGLACCAEAQWLGIPAKGIPRLKNGQPNLAARAPKRDLSGTWRVPATTLGDGGPPRYVTYLAADMPQNSVPLKQEAREVIGKRLAGAGKDIPFSRCLPAGLPMVMLFPVPFKIMQSPGLTAILYETNNTYRQIFTDGRALPASPNPAWLGYSIGRWEGDTFVVESTGFNSKTWIDAIGHPHGERLKVTERYRRLDYGHMTVAITIDDPDWYERPWTVTIPLQLAPDDELIEDICLENERDAVHLVGQ